MAQVGEKLGRVWEERGQNRAAPYIHSQLLDGHNCTTQICKNTVLAGCNTILTIFHKQFHTLINYFILGSHGVQ